MDDLGKSSRYRIIGTPQENGDKVVLGLSLKNKIVLGGKKDF